MGTASVESSRALAVLWGKSDAAGSPTLLVQHLLDTAAVAEVMWDRYLAPGLKQQIDDLANGSGRELFALLCGLHDVGKATPAFQSKDDALAAKVRSAGLTWRVRPRDFAQWHHSGAGAAIIREVLRDAGWPSEAVDWVWPLIAGHHGVVPAGGSINPARRSDAHGVGQGWRAAQCGVVDAVVTGLGLDLRESVPSRVPRRGVQLALSGLVIMADWIASSDCFPGVQDLTQVSIQQSRRRAAAAWAQLELRGGWGDEPHRRAGDLIAARFGRPARAVQTAGIELAEKMVVPGLFICEAPMGEGKTELALAVAEVLGRRFGRDGIFVGMPTQATSDPMFTRVRGWADRLDPELPVGLLHGKRMFNKVWAEQQSRIRFSGIDEFGCDDEFAAGEAGGGRALDHAVAEWYLLAAKRGMLMPVTVGTIDHLLYAATKTKHVMLRHAGLAGRVVILDEVHAYDVYMSQFLHEALRWLGDAGVPVVLLSATLPPPQRTSLMRAYQQGVQQRRDVQVPPLAADEGFPVLRALTVTKDDVSVAQVSTLPWRPPIQVSVQQVDEAPDAGPDAVVDILDRELRDGGCALVIRNTVGRAQQTFAALAERWGDEQVLLLHARLTVADRAARTEQALRLLGPARPDVRRPSRLIVVATQLAEQSFDVDADLLVTDLAPIDLLLQRIGRIHRHDRPGRKGDARVFITGMISESQEPPVFPAGSEYVYGRYPLLKAAALVAQTAGQGWSVPADVPDLVRRGYDDSAELPQGWHQAVTDARTLWQAKQDERQRKATDFLLSEESALGTPTLDGLHERSTAQANTDEQIAAVVRDGPETVEAILVRSDGSRHLSLAGRPLGPGGLAGDETLTEELLGSTVRLPARRSVTAAARDLLPLPGWYGDSWLGRARALVLNEASAAVVGGRRLVYDTRLGLVDEGGA